MFLLRAVMMTAILAGWALAAQPRAGNKPDQEMLQGKWVCVSTLKDGKKVKDYVGVRAVMKGDKLTWHYPNKDGSYREQQCRFRFDPAKKPKHFDWWAEDKRESIDKRIYVVTADELRWATNLDRKTRPKSFDAGRWQFTMKRDRKRN